jgi:hypothetical protein
MRVRIQLLLNRPMRILKISEEVMDDLAAILARMLDAS